MRVVQILYRLQYITKQKRYEYIYIYIIPIKKLSIIIIIILLLLSCIDRGAITTQTYAHNPSKVT